MPRRTQGSVYRTRTGYGIRWPENGERPHQAGRIPHQDRGAPMVRREHCSPPRPRRSSVAGHQVRRIL